MASAGLAKIITAIVGDIVSDPVRKRIRLEPWYSIEVPYQASFEYDDDLETLEIDCKLDEASAIFVARWRFLMHDNADREVAIDQLLRGFCLEAIPRNSPVAIENEYKYLNKKSGRIVRNQGIVPIDLSDPIGDRRKVWIVRYEVCEDDNYFYFLHWNGRIKDANKYIFTIFDSFRQKFKDDTNWPE